MDAYRCVGFKSILVRGVFLLLSLFFLISVNFFLFHLSLLRVVFATISGLLWRSLMRILTRVYYEFLSDRIVLHLPNKHSVSFLKKDIVRVAPYESDLYYTKGLGVFRMGSVFFCITSWNHLLHITLRDGKECVISPRIVHPQLFTYFSA